jgi:hypothetical protein
MKQIIFIMIASFFMASCGHYPDGTSVWAGQMWLIPLISIPAALWSFYRAYRASKSSSEMQLRDGKWLSSKENVPIYKHFSFIVGCGLILLNIIVAIWINSEK